MMEKARKNTSMHLTMMATVAPKDYVTVFWSSPFTTRFFFSPVYVKSILNSVMS